MRTLYLAVRDGVEDSGDFVRRGNVGDDGVRGEQGVVHHDGENIVDDHDISLRGAHRQADSE